MAELLPIIVLALIFILGLLLIPLGLPGVWLMVVGLVGYAALTGFERIGAALIVTVVALALLTEVLDAVMGFRFARRFGGSSRAGWGAIAGGLIGAVIGTPVPIIGNVIGAFLGAFVGAVGLEAAGHGELGRSLSAGWGALLGRAAAAAIKIAIGLTIAVLSFFAVLT